MITRRDWRTAVCGMMWTVLIGVAGSASAQSDSGSDTKIVSIPAERYYTSPGDVDLRTGRYVYNSTDVSIGGDEAAGGIQLVRTLNQTTLRHQNPFGNFSSNWDINIIEFRLNLTKGNSPTNNSGVDYRMDVHYGGLIEGFTSPSNAVGYGPISQTHPGSLTFTGDRSSASAVYTFTAGDGTIIVFRPIGNLDCSDIRCADAAKITEPDGTVLTLDYDYNSTAGGNRARLRSVVSSRGYAIMFEGSGSLISKACTLNLAVTPIPANHLCPSNALSVATYSYASNSLSTITDPVGGVSHIAYGTRGSLATMAFTKPGAGAPWLTNVLDNAFDEYGQQFPIVAEQDFADGRILKYGFDYPPVTDDQPYSVPTGGAFTENSGKGFGIEFGFPVKPGSNPGSSCTHLPCQPVTIDSTVFQITQGPVSISDPNGNVTSFNYCDPVAQQNLPSNYHDRCIAVALQDMTDPEGIKSVFTYGDYGDVVKVERFSKPGSSLSSQVTTATYDCSIIKFCTKPTSITDANGSVTNYTYSGDHGGLLVKTGPAVNGVRPQTRYTYAQRYSWISDGAGGYSRSITPIWLLTQESFCKTGAAASSGSGCALGASDELVTTYDYGPDSGPNTLLLRGKVVDASGLMLRTCFGYDSAGRKISETSPRAGLTSCP